MVSGIFRIYRETVFLEINPDTFYEERRQKKWMGRLFVFLVIRVGITEQITRCG